MQIWEIKNMEDDSNDMHDIPAKDLDEALAKYTLAVRKDFFDQLLRVVVFDEGYKNRQPAIFVRATGRVVAHVESRKV